MLNSKAKIFGFFLFNYQIIVMAQNIIFESLKEI